MSNNSYSESELMNCRNLEYSSSRIIFGLRINLYVVSFRECLR